MCVRYKSRERTLQEVGQGLGPEHHRPLGLVVGDGELLHAQFLRHFGLRAVVDQRAAEKLRAQKERNRIHAKLTAKNRKNKTKKTARTE